MSDLTFSSGLFGKQMGGLARRSFQRHRVSVWDLSEFKDIVQVFDHILIRLRSAGSEEAAACMSEG